MKNAPGSMSLRAALPWLVAALAGVPALAQDNNNCEDATPVEFGELVTVDLDGATADGQSTCSINGNRDRWYRWQAPRSETTFVLTDTTLGIDVSIHTECLGIAANQLTCGPRTLGPDLFGLPFEPTAGETYYLRVSEVLTQSEPYRFTLTPGGIISGVVTNGDGEPLEGIEVEAGATRDFTDADGRYRLGGLRLSSWVVAAGDDSPYVAEFYDNIPCPYLVCFQIPDFIDSGPGQQATANFSLELGAAIAGTVTDDVTGLPLPEQTVRLFGQDASTADLTIGTSTDTDGRFRFQGLIAGRYTLEAGGSGGYVREIWDDMPCIPANCRPELGTPIEVDLEETVDGVDFGLRQGLSLSGQLRDAASGELIPNSLLEIRDLNGSVLEISATGFDGRYSFVDLAPGEYLLNTASFRHVNEVWPGVRCGYSVECPVDLATPVVLTDASLDGFDFELDLGGSVTAVIRDELTGVAPPRPRFTLYDADGEVLSSLRGFGSDPVEIAGLPTGEYRAIASSDAGAYGAELYDGLDCEGPPEFCGAVVAGTPIPVVEGQAQTLDFTLEFLAST
ncbi:MAG: carboxypeptidase regulatory-like domain-containing protein, partial [Acidobacteriota bacterium]